ncbi:MAG: 2OG-Fe(II) oxygenase family protein [Pseudomonadota bacterium]|nr:2OG-Fe(II) oxygenase family protein [Pseudomonadota bacterium]
MDTTPVIPPNLFALSAVPMAEIFAGNAESLNRELTDLILGIEASEAAYRNSVKRDTQQGIFESRFDFHKRPEPPARALFQFLHAALCALVKDLNGYTSEEMQRISFDYHTWFHITRTGGYQGVHNHPNASWSGIYCIDAGDETDDINSGAVRFHDARGSAEMYSDPGNERMRSPYRHGGLHLRHQAGRLIVFPSYLMHEVFAYTGQRPRIVAAFNAWCRWR